jgi:hypothetical protein
MTQMYLKNGIKKFFLEVFLHTIENLHIIFFT